MNNEAKRELAFLLCNQAGNLVEFWGEMGERYPELEHFTSAQVSQQLGRWLQYLPGNAFDLRLTIPDHFPHRSPFGVEERRELAFVLMSKAGNLVEFWEEMRGDAPELEGVTAEQVSRALGRWLVKLPGTVWDIRLTDPNA